MSEETASFNPMQFQLQSWFPHAIASLNPNVKADKVGRRLANRLTYKKRLDVLYITTPLTPL